MQKEYIGQLTGIRIFLTLMVVVSNMILFNDVDPGFMYETNSFFLNMFASTPFRVDIFFMLTGFLLFYVYKKEFSENITGASYVKFFIIRMARLYPVHLLTMCLIGILYLCGIWQSTGLNSAYRVVEEGNWFLNVTLMNAWGLNGENASWNGPAWSISAELFNYLLFPVMALLVANIKKFWVHIVLFLGVLIVYEYMQLAIIKDLSVFKGSAALMRGFIGMTLGILLAQIYISKKLEKLPWDLIALLLIITIALIMVLMTTHVNEMTERPQAYILSYIALPFLIMSVASSKTFIKKFFSLPPLVYLGNLSFCIYMLHQPITRIFSVLFQDHYNIIREDKNEIMIAANLCVILLAMILISAIVYKYIEVPVRNRIKKKLKISSNK